MFDRRQFWQGSAILIGLTATTAIRSEALADECASYYGQGYCTDYVNSRISPRQSGDAKRWPSNMPAEAVAPGDVVIFRSDNHVAYVEEVTRRDSNGRPTEIRISEMNWGRGLRPGTPPSCVVTSKFGIRDDTRRVSLSGKEFLRPGGYRPARLVPNPALPSPGIGNTANTTPQTIPRRRERR